MEEIMVCWTIDIRNSLHCIINIQHCRVFGQARARNTDARQF